ncbi:hypothetical protein LINGRAHAP2_LOCUS21828 [Linum grandiflorum]
MGSLAFAVAIVLLLAVALTSPATADPYDNPSAPPPPSAVAGKEFPQSVVCNDPSTKCFGQNIACPFQCPSFKPSDPSTKACSVDCNTPKCEAVCKNRNANCNGMGSACGDPRFVGGDGIIFYFHGKSNQHFSLVSDSHFQVNARFIGRRPEGRRRDNTWIQSLGLMFGPHTFTFGANKVANWDDSVDQFHFAYDGNMVNIAPGHLSTWMGPDSPLIVERTAETNVILVTLPDVVELSARVVPITKEDDRVHNYQIPNDDCFAHLEMQFRSVAWHKV